MTPLLFRNYPLFLVFLTFVFAASVVRAAPPVSFSRQVLPLLKAQCWSCHAGASTASGYSMETRDRLIGGGRHGAAVTIGKGSSSSLVQYMTGELKPKMPPNGAIDLERIALIRRWIDEGAKVDTMSLPPPPAGSAKTAFASLPIKQKSDQPAPVTSMVYSPDGKILAVGGYRVVRFLDALTGAVTNSLTGAADQVQALAWSGDGKLLAVAGGVPGMSGEILIYNVATGKIATRLAGHAEAVYCVAWKPKSSELASGSLDKTAKIWNTATGICTRTIKDHAEAVFGIAYSPDGSILATGSGDRSAKLFRTSDWKRTDTLNSHQDGITKVAFSPDGKLLATVGADKTMKTWKVEPGKIENPIRTNGEGDVINACAFSPDGNLLVWGASNHTVRAFSGDGANQKLELKQAEDWIYCVAVSADSQTIAAGAQNGKALFWNVKDGKLLRTVTLLPGVQTVEIASEAKK